MIDLSKCLPPWPVTGKRGRKGSVSTGVLPGLDERIHEGVVNLVMNDLYRRADDLVENQDSDNLVMPSNNQMETKRSKWRRKIGSIDINSSEDDNDSGVVNQTEKKCTYCGRTFKSLRALSVHKRDHNRYEAKEKREVMEETAGAETKHEDENDADITCSNIEMARMKQCSDKFNRKEGRISDSDDKISDSDDIKERDLNEDPNYVPDRENDARRAADATTAGQCSKNQVIKLSSKEKNRKKRKIESIDINTSRVDNGSKIVKQAEAKCTYCDRIFKSLHAMHIHESFHRQHKPKEKRETMKESAGEETKPEDENDADITGSKITKWSSDNHNEKDERILDSDIINELDLNKSPTAGEGRRCGEHWEGSKFDLNRSPI